MSELHGYYLEDLAVGMTAMHAKTVTEADILLFSGVSGDMNPLHHNEEFARTTMFGERVAHGMLTASIISAVFGTKLPGPGCIYLTQTLNFRAPVRLGDTVVARVTVTEIDTERKRASFSTVCTVAGTVVLDGTALIRVPSRRGQGVAASPAQANEA